MIRRSKTINYSDFSNNTFKIIKNSIFRHIYENLMDSIGL